MGKLFRLNSAQTTNEVFGFLMDQERYKRRGITFKDFILKGKYRKKEEEK
jgi:hypothetical protein